MPLLYRNVVPNVPAWTAGNGSIVFGSDGNPSYRAEMRATASFSGTIALGSDLTSLGFPSNVSIANASDGVCYRENRNYQEELWGHYNDTEADYGTWNGFARKFHATFGWSDNYGTQINLGELPAVFPDAPGMADPAQTYLYIARDWRFVHDWTAAMAISRWHGWPMSGVSVPYGWEFDEYMSNPFLDPDPKLAIAIVQSYSYYDNNSQDPPVFGNILVGGAACGANSSFDRFRFSDTRQWPLDNLRLGTGHDLWFEGVQDRWNIDDIDDLKITLSATYA